MPEFNYAKGRINDSLQFIATEIKEFEDDYISIGWKEYKENRKLQKLMDRTVENIFTVLIEICGTILKAARGRSSGRFSNKLKNVSDRVRVPKRWGLALKKACPHLGFWFFVFHFYLSV